MTENRLKEFRVKAGLSQVELARRAGIASTNLNAVECGRLVPWTKFKRRLARVLKVSQTELFPEDNANGSN